MGIFTKIFRRSEPHLQPDPDEPPVQPPKVEEGNGRQAATRLRTLLEEAELHRWNPQLGIKVLCPCGAVGKITYNLEPIPFLEKGWALCFWKDREGAFADFDKQIVCPKCDGQTFSLRHSPVTIRGWLPEGLGAIEPCQDDVESGMRDDESGELFHDHGFDPASTVDGIWKLIKWSVDPLALVVPDYKADRLWTKGGRSRHVERLTLIHIVNRNDNMYFDIFKDASGRYWVSKCFAY